MSELHCPACRCRLRLRDRRLIGQTIPCPDCGASLLVGVSPIHFEEFVVEQAGTALPPAGAPSAISPVVPEKGRLVDASSKDRTSKASSSKKRRTPTKPIASVGVTPTVSSSRWQPLWETLTSPLAVAWIAAGVVAAAIGVALLRESASTPRISLIDEPDQKLTPSNRETSPAEPQETDLAKLRLKDMGQWLAARQAERGSWPEGSLPGKELSGPDRWSWLTPYVDERLKADGSLLSYNPARRWSSSGEDRFVRRSVPFLQMPEVRDLTGVDGRPATHLVGAAGVGADGPQLPANHPRAGIFAENRSTRVDDVTDGLSNTVLVAPVESHLGSWAASGTATIRPFTGGSVIGGPDGFGAGRKDFMPVLLADGSVREIPGDISPSVMERMFAMRDGYSLDDDISPDLFAIQAPRNEKPIGPEPPVARDIPGVAAKPTPANPPAPEFGPAVSAMEAIRLSVDPKVRLKTALELPIRRWRTPVPVPFEQLVMPIEELTSLPIRFQTPELKEKVRGKPVNLDLQNITLGQLLDQICQQAGLIWELEGTEIVLQEARPT